MGKKHQKQTRGPESAATLLAEGHRLLQSGRAPEAEQSFRRALALEPNSADAARALGGLLVRTGRAVQAIELLARAVELAPGVLATRIDLAIAQQAAGDASAAASTLDRALSVDALDPQLHTVRASVMNQLGRFGEAVRSADTALLSDPKNAAALLQRGDGLAADGKYDSALESYRRAIAVNPAAFDAQLRLTNLLVRLGRSEEAVTSAREALARRPQDPAMATNLANLLAGAGEADEARRLVERVIQSQPGYSPAYAVLADLCRRSDDLPGAIAAMRQVVRLSPNSAPSRAALARMLNEEGRHDEALALLEPNVKSPSTLTPALRVLHALLLPPILSDRQEAQRACDRLQSELRRLTEEGVRIEDPLQQIDVTSASLTYYGVRDRPIQEQIASFYLDACPALRREPMARELVKGRKVRLGLVSSTLYKHTTGRLWGRLFAGLPSDDLEMVFFRAPSKRDWVTDEIVEASAKTVELAADLRTAQEQILGEDVDFLLYTEVSANRLTYYLSFCRLAPHQGVMWGHPMTTGSPAMDYFISNEDMETPSSDELYTEQLVRLPGLTIVMEQPFMPDSTGGRARLGLPEDAHLYACPQMPMKLHPDFEEVAFEILRRDPNGRLVLISARESWGAIIADRHRRQYPDLADRVILLPQLDFGDFLTLAQVADAVLTPFPFGAGLSTLDMAGVGVPTVALEGSELKSRITYAVYRKMGMLDLIAPDAEGYIELALRMANDREFHMSMRQKTLERMETLYSDASCIDDLRRYLLRAVQVPAS